MERIICLAIGYLFGMFQTSYIIGKIHHMDIRQYGSGNAGTTNALRTLGKKAGAMTLIGDMLKCVIAILIVDAVFENRYQEILPLLGMYTAAGCVLGHNFPFYLGFRGGKGIAASAGMLLAMDWRVFLICAVIFIGLVAITRYVSLGSMAAYAGALVCLHWVGACRKLWPWISPIHLRMDVIMGLMTALAIYRHRANIYRLLNGTENKLGAAKTAAK